jgi:hypothetical protein
MLSPTQTLAFTRAKAYLAATGLPYAIRMPDGSVEGILLIAPEKSKVQRPRVNNFAAETGYPSILEAMKPGQSHVFTCANNVKAEAMRSAISANACARWGKGNGITCVVDTMVEVLRVA